MRGSTHAAVEYIAARYAVAKYAVVECITARYAVTE